MKRKCKIVIIQSNRSDFPLSDPIIWRLKLDSTFEVIVLKVVPSSYRGAYAVAKNCCIVEKPDILLACGDRLEMGGAVAGAFQNHIRPYIVHYEAGVTNDKIATFDDIDRHLITLQSSLQLCEDQGSYERVCNLFSILRLESNAFVVGITRHDDLQVDFSKVPKDCPFDLVLYNPPTMYDEDILSILKLDDNKLTIWIQGNDDPTIKDYYWDVKQKYKHVVYYPNQPRPKFLGLLSRCEKYYTNSSNIKSEAPLFKKAEDIIPIGDRNLLRSTPTSRDQGASDRIIKILKSYWEHYSTALPIIKLGGKKW